MKIYTRTGDAGQTGLIGNLRTAKDDPRVATYGTVDELNAVLGVARLEFQDGPEHIWIARLQNDLFEVGVALATVVANDATPAGLGPVAARIDEMEKQMDEWTAALPELRTFILPGGSRAAAQLHLARTVCRRAERLAVTLVRSHPVDGGVIRYLNRLSDFLFVMARWCNYSAGVADIAWKREGGK